MYTISKRRIAERRHREDSSGSTEPRSLRALISSGEVSVVIPVIESPVSCGTLHKHILKDKRPDPECTEMKSRQSDRELSKYRNRSATIIPILRIISTLIMRLLYRMDSTSNLGEVICAAMHGTDQNTHRRLRLSLDPLLLSLLSLA